ncbi:hypothetical protein RIR_jg11551.t1 [Rhizophagus irregularis DAOM 181602=DAOM 197198]|nr:hypothetical protein RIR_jg11551.t1 [Rhizophagus irregularis DAOM 181602=DAOM 197198]
MSHNDLWISSAVISPTMSWRGNISQPCSTLFKAQYNMMMNRNYMPNPKLKTSYIKFKVNDDSYLIRLFLQLNENTYGRIDVIISKKPIEETTEGKLLKEMGVDVDQGLLYEHHWRGRTIKLFDHFTESFLLNHKVIELLAESSEYICAFQPTDSNVRWKQLPRKIRDAEKIEAISSKEGRNEYQTLGLSMLLREGKEITRITLLVLVFISYSAFGKKNWKRKKKYLIFSFLFGCSFINKFLKCQLIFH